MGIIVGAIISMKIAEQATPEFVYTAVICNVLMRKENDD